ncbi:hypothetical protein HO133_002732 [Letharia lupina]|uniref:HMG box domain-containing protein n=1 Tax=Letharia lupina TaxID=560253 RepID=A0A8H6CD84_9LECA|nr:uncharacterized protein HO133_002732 [Letharia lupina]KAF6221051.1 hypothetical protein HO133_002732 [Letharia lupina]
MSVAAMVKQPPPTPPSVDGRQLQDGFGHLVQHNARGEHQANIYALDNSPYIPSGATSFDNTPEPEIGQWYMDQYGNKSFRLYQEQNGLGVDMSFDAYGQQVFHPQQQGVYNPYALQQQHQYPNPMIHGRAPPTPEMADQSAPQPRSTRQNRLGAGSRHPSGSPRPRKAARKKNTVKTKTLSGPLSELTKDMINIQIKDTETWVNRSVEDRREEAKKDNFVKRPSNSFILYRSAYADRARAWEKSPNHQKISSLAGESWAMEPPEIRKQFDAWAKVERENHAKAFPDYKFQPQTAKATNRKRKGRAGDSEDELSDNGSDYTYAPNGAGWSLKPKKSKRPYRETSYTPSGTSLDEYDPNGFDAAELFHHPSSYQTHNPGKPLPAALNQQALHNQYYQTTSHPNQRMAHLGHVEDVFVHPIDGPSEYHHPALPVIGIPGAYHHELQGEDSGQQMMSGNSQLDPMLASYDQSHPQYPSTSGNEHINHSMSIQAGEYQTPAYSPVLNDFESEHEDAEPEMGSDEWFAQQRDRS